MNRAQDLWNKISKSLSHVIKSPKREKKKKVDQKFPEFGE